MIFSLNNVVLSFNAPSVYPQAITSLSTVGVVFILVVFAAVSWGFYQAFSYYPPIKGRTWDCGYYQIGARNEYTATAFSKPFRIAFSFFLLPYRRTSRSRETLYHIKSFVHETYTTFIFRKYIYQPAAANLFRIARKLRKIQSGSIHLYIGYIFITLILLIVFMKRF